MFTDQAALEQYICDELTTKGTPKVLLKHMLPYAIEQTMNLTIPDDDSTEAVKKGLLILSFPIADDRVNQAINRTFKVVSMHPAYTRPYSALEIIQKRMENLRKRKRRKTIQSR